MKTNSYVKQTWAVFLTLAALHVGLRAEASCDANSLIASLAAANSGQGRTDVDSCILSEAVAGNVNPLQTWALTNMQYSGCSAKVIDEAPAMSDSYQIAKQKFTSGVCKIYSCYRYGMILSMLPSLSTKPDKGGTTSGAARCANLKFMMTTLGQTLTGCTTNDGISDQVLIAFMQQQQSAMQCQ